MRRTNNKSDRPAVPRARVAIDAIAARAGRVTVQERVLVWNIVSHYVSDHRGLSPLQKDILAVLEEYPAREDFPEEGTISLSLWAHAE
jgi:hypothetical protein